MNPDLKNIKTIDLQIGMYIQNLGKSWLSHPWLTQKKYIRSQRDIEILFECGIKEVIVDLSKSKYDQMVIIPEEDDESLKTKEKLTLLSSNADELFNEEKDIDIKGSGLSEAKSVIEQDRELESDKFPLEVEILRARALYSKSLRVVRQFFSDIQSGKQLRIDVVQKTIEQMIDSVFRNRYALQSLIKVKNYDEYTYTHSLNVAVLALTFGRNLDLEQSELFYLCMGAILHDLGKIKIPLSIMNKPGQLTPEEYELIKTHPELGKELVLRDYRDASEKELAVISQHHERVNGEGYPYGHTELTIHPMAIMAGICDVYDALTSNRVYRKGMPPHFAMKFIFNMSNQQFPSKWIERFIKCIGIYPAGSVIKLNNGEVGVVYEVNHDALLRPKVKLIGENRRRKRFPSLLNLNNIEHQDLDIVEVIDPGVSGLDISMCF